MLSLWKKMYIIAYHVGFQMNQHLPNLDKIWWHNKWNKIITHWDSFLSNCSSVRTEEIIELTTDLTTNEPPEEFEMVMDLPSDEDSKMDIKNEPENDYRDKDKDEYKDVDGSDDVAIFGIEEEGTQSHWYY